MPRWRPLARPCLFPSQPLVADRFARACQTIDERGAVPDGARSDPVWKLVVTDEIPEAKVDRVDPKVCRCQVDQPLHDEPRDRPSDPAVRTHRRLRLGNELRTIVRSHRFLLGTLGSRVPIQARRSLTAASRTAVTMFW